MALRRCPSRLGNYIGIQEAPGVMYNKLVSMPDALMWRYFELLSFRSMDEIEQFKSRLSRALILAISRSSWPKRSLRAFHGEEAALTAHRSAGNRMKEGELPEDLPEIEVVSVEDMPISALLNKAGLVKNAAMARDLLGSGGVRVDGEVVDRSFIYKVGGACLPGRQESICAHYALAREIRLRYCLLCLAGLLALRSCC